LSELLHPQKLGELTIAQRKIDRRAELGQYLDQTVKIA